MGRLKEVPFGGTKLSLLGHLKHVRNRAAQLGARSSKEIPFGGKNLGEKSLGQNGKIQRKFLLVALKPLLAFSLMFSNRPGFVCSASFLKTN